VDTKLSKEDSPSIFRVRARYRIIEEGCEGCYDPRKGSGTETPVLENINGKLAFQGIARKKILRTFESKKE
jgi:hypothetical protein